MGTVIHRNTLVEIFLKQQNISTSSANIEYYSRQWFHSKRSGVIQSFKLSDQGFEFLSTELKLQFYEVTFDEPISLNPQTIIFIDRYITSPYYMSPNSIIVFDSKLHFELSLFSEDISKFGLIKAINARQQA